MTGAPELIALGLAAGMVAGMLGVGGGVLFVPGLILFADFGVVEADATSLLAIIPVALAGAYNQGRHGNVRVSDGLLVGVLAAGGAAAGVALANVLPERVLEVGFALLMVFVAGELVRRVARKRRAEPEVG